MVLLVWFNCGIKIIEWFGIISCVMAFHEKALEIYLWSMSVVNCFGLLIWQNMIGLIIILSILGSHLVTSCPVFWLVQMSLVHVVFKFQSNRTRVRLEVDRDLMKRCVSVCLIWWWHSHLFKWITLTEQLHQSSFYSKKNKIKMPRVNTPCVWGHEEYQT